MKLDYGDYYILDLNGKMMDAHMTPAPIGPSRHPGEFFRHQRNCRLV